MTDDNKNVYIAIALSILVIIGWNFFYGWPQMEKTRHAQQQAQTQSQSAAPPQSGTPRTGGRCDARNDFDPAGARRRRLVRARRSPIRQSTRGSRSSGAEAVLSHDAALAASPRVTIDTRSLSGSDQPQGRPHR